MSEILYNFRIDDFKDLIMIKNIIYRIGLLSSILLSNLAFAKGPLLVLDALNASQLPANFRSSSDPFPTQTNLSQEGLASLHEIGSAQFSERELIAVIEKINAPITIIDLRQESHGFIDGNAISWYGLRDWANLGKTPEEVEQDQQQRLASLEKQNIITISKISDKNSDGAITKTIPIKLDIHHVMSEAGLIYQHQLNYARIYVTDGWPPSTEQIEQFVKFVQALPKDMWLYFHCRAGKGRTTTFMVMYDMLKNAKKVSFNDILQRQALLGGNSLLNLPEQDSYKYSLANKRIEFLKKFYNYCLSNKDNYQTLFSVWEKNNSHTSKS